MGMIILIENEADFQLFVSVDFEENVIWKVHSSNVASFSQNITCSEISVFDGTGIRKDVQGFS
jgi:hypothetical protein